MANAESGASKGTIKVKPAGRQLGRRSEVTEDSRGVIAAPARRAPKDGARDAAAAKSEGENARAKGTKGRPVEVEDSVIVTVRMPRGLVNQLDDLVKRSGFKYRDRSELIRQTMADHAQHAANFSQLVAARGLFAAAKRQSEAKLSEAMTADDLKSLLDTGQASVVLNPALFK